jgi:hypothetical protein
MGSLQLKMVDESGEMPVIEIPIADLAGDITAEIGAINVFVPLLLAITTLNVVHQRVVAWHVDQAWTKPTDPWAQKEIAWIVHFHDAVNGRKRTRRIPGADLTLKVAGTDRMNIASGAGQSFVTGFESIVLSDDGNAVVVDYIELEDN